VLSLTFARYRSTTSSTVTYGGLDIKSPWIGNLCNALLHKLRVDVARSWNDVEAGQAPARTAVRPTAGVAGSPHAVTASDAIGGGLSNCAITYLPADLTVTLRPITVGANDLSQPIGQLDPSLAFAVTEGSLVNCDALSGALATTADSSSLAGPVPDYSRDAGGDAELRADLCRQTLASRLRPIPRDRRPISGAVRTASFPGSRNLSFLYPA
jgi:hypothetical protein